MSRLRPIQQYASVVAIVLWLGGFTFYATLVVPSGELVVGRVPQGYVTQRVTDGLNVIGCVLLLFMLVDLMLHRKYLSPWAMRARCLGLVVFGVGLVMLFELHNHMDALMDRTTLAKPDRVVFKPMHQRYQMIFTFMWMATVLELAMMLHGHQRRAVAEHAPSQSNSDTG